MSERARAFAVGDVDVGTVGDEKLHDFLMFGTAVAEDDRLQQCGPAEIVDVIDIDLGFEQLTHDFDMAIMAGGNQCVAAVLIGAPHVGACG